MDSVGTSGSTSNRRGFLRHLMGEARDQLGHFAREVSAAAGQDANPAPRRISAARALPTRGHVVIDDVLVLAEECGLSRRLDAVRRLVARSVRLTLCDSSQVTPETSWLGDPQVRPAELVWSGEQEPRCLAGIDLAQAAAVLGDESLLPVEGTLWCFAPSTAGLVPHQVGLQDYYVVMHRGESVSTDAMISPWLALAPSWRSVELSAELQLPRVWSDSVQALELDEVEHDGWQRLRQQLAERQGVEVHDTTPGFKVMHRLLGYPDERRGDMPLACELLAGGDVLANEPPLAHPHAVEAEPNIARWQLLLQLSVDDELGWTWGGRRERLYVWIDQRDLATGNFARVYALAH
jgi:hypothetical protein